MSAQQREIGRLTEQLEALDHRIEVNTARLLALAALIQSQKKQQRDRQQRLDALWAEIWAQGEFHTLNEPGGDEEEPGAQENAG